MDPSTTADSSVAKTADSDRQTEPSIHGNQRWWLRQVVTTCCVVAAALALIVVLGIAQRIGWISAGTSPTAAAGNAASATYICPMHPQIRQPQPGNCPICGMPLEAASTGGDSKLDEFAVRIEPAARRLANIKTMQVVREAVTTTIETVGAIAIDESRMATIPSYIDGRVEQLFADYTGVNVQKDDHLAIVYSPELYTAQVEYLKSLTTIESTSPAALEMVRKAQQELSANLRQRLVELGMTSEQVAELERSGKAQSRLTIYSPVGGTVIEKLAMEGKYLQAGEPIYRIADLSTVWLMLELYPEDASRIRFGQRVEAQMQSLPGETFTGRVAFIDPTVDSGDRTVGVRVEFSNDDGRLRPGDYAKAKIFLPIGDTGEVYDSELAGRWISPMHPQIIRDDPGPCPICGMDLVPTSRYGYSAEPVEQPVSLVAPRSAVLMAGENSVVYVETEPGRFEIRPVTLGPVLRDRVIIQRGLREGDKVATAGNFLIDSQMQLAGKPSLIDPTRAIAAQSIRKTPLELEEIQVEPVDGERGKLLHDLFTSYFNIQRSLASDEPPDAKDAETLHDRAGRLVADEEFTKEVTQLLKEIETASEHLHHLDIEDGRLKAFRPISHAVVRLAALVRPEPATQTYAHMFCPMVKGGGGDWLQPNADLRNPYWGSRMLTCGEVVRQFPEAGAPASESSDPEQSAATQE